MYDSNRFTTRTAVSTIQILINICCCYCFFHFVIRFWPVVEVAVALVEAALVEAVVEVEEVDSNHIM